jgi:hypothetical protein
MQLICTKQLLLSRSVGLSASVSASFFTGSVMINRFAYLFPVGRNEERKSVDVFQSILSGVTGFVPYPSKHS